jgi:hypothetical protein
MLIDATASSSGGAHTGGAGKSFTGYFQVGDKCEDHWGDAYDFNEAQEWCCDSWCYVDKTKCTKEVADALGIDVAQSWTKTDMWYRCVNVLSIFYHLCQNLLLLLLLLNFA